MTCPNCSGEGCIEKFDILNKNKSFMGRCMRCSDGKLTNKIKYYKDFHGIALPNSIRERLGNPVPFTKIKISLIGVHHDICSGYENSTYAFYWDIQKDNNCRCGHDKKYHGLTMCLNGDCNCKQYEQRIADLTPAVFEKLTPLSKGLIKGRIEVV